MVFFLCIPCLVLVLYFLIIAIFFPQYMPYLKEAWKCFMDKLKGKKCSVSFDNKMRLAFSMWLTKKGYVKAGAYFYDQKKFNRFFTIFGILFILISTILFVLLIKFLFFGSPCSTGDGCSIG